jgi:HEAT repeat protein
MLQITGLRFVIIGLLSFGLLPGRSGAASPALEILIADLKDRDEKVREQAARDLQLLGDARSVEGLIEALEDKNQTVRYHASVALGGIGNSLAVKPLIEAMKNPEKKKRSMLASQPLGSVGPISFSLSWSISSPVVMHSGVASASLVAIGGPAVDSLIEEVIDGERTAAWTLGWIGDVRAVDPLLEALRGDNYYLRKAAVSALGRIGDARAVQPLVAALHEDEDNLSPTGNYWFFQQEVGRSLASIGEPAVESLIGVLSEGGNVRKAASEALASIGEPAGAKLRVASDSGEKNVKKTARKILEKIEKNARENGNGAIGEHLRPVLRWCFKDLVGKDDEQRSTASMVLGWVGGTDAVLPLVDALGNNNKKVRAASAYALGRIGDIRAVETLEEALNDKEKEVRESAAQALGWIGNPRGIKPLSLALADKDKGVRLAAAHGLGLIGQPAFAALKGALGNSDKAVRKEAARALGLIADSRSLGLLVAATKDSEKDVRASAVRALGLIGDESSTDPVKASLRDKHHEVRAAAGKALSHIKYANRSKQ